MSLKLEDFSKQDEIIEFGKKKFKVSANIPLKLMFEFESKREQMSALDTKNIGYEQVKSLYKDIRTIIKAVLKLKNKNNIFNRWSVDRFVDKLGYVDLLKVMSFIINYYQAVDEKKKDRLKNILYIVKEFKGSVTLKELLNSDYILYLAMYGLIEEEIKQIKKNNSKTNANNIINKMKGKR